MAQDKLFGRIEAWHGDAPWGEVLDAGTGDHSLGWIWHSKPTVYIDLLAPLASTSVPSIFAASMNPSLFPEARADWPSATTRLMA